MKRSRLNLFRATSMTISILGVLMVIFTIAILVYIGFQGISSQVSTNIDKGSAYDELALLKSEYGSLKMQYDSLSDEIKGSNKTELDKAYVNAELELVKANSAISDVESALDANKPIEEVNSRLYIAKKQLQKARSSLSNVQAMI
jgi:hypothetical protein